MTRQDEELEVSNLLRERSALRRFNLELPPQKLLLLKRLLYRLGWTKMLNSKKKYGRTQTTDLLLNQLHEDYTRDPKSVAPGTTLRLIAADAFDEADEPHVAETLRSDNPIFTFGGEDAPPRIFKVIAGTTYDAKTPHEVVRHLESARLGRHRIRLHYGDTETGRDWMEEYDVAGTVGRSMGNGQGLHRTPILLATNRSRGGLVILDHAIVRIRDNMNRDLWRHPNYHHGKVDVISLDHPSFGPGYNPLRDTHPYRVLVDNKSHARFQTRKALQTWIRRMGLTVGPQGSQRMKRKKYARDSDRNPLIKGLQEHTQKFRGKGDMTPSLIFADHLAETSTPGEVAIREAVKANDVWRQDLEDDHGQPGFHTPQRMVVDGEDYEPGKEYWWGVTEARQNKEFPWVFHVTHRGDKDSDVGYGGRPYTPSVTHSVGVKSLGHLMHLMRDFPEIHRTQARKAAQAWLQRRQNPDRLSRKKYARDSTKSRLLTDFPSQKENLPFRRRFARLTLGASRPFRGPFGEAMTEHDYHDETGAKLGVIRVQPRNDGRHLHVHWVGPENASGGDPKTSNTVGPEGMISLKQQLKTVYPQAEFISGVRAGGFRKKEGGGGPERVVKPMQRKKYARPHVPFSEVKNSMWGNVRHRSGLSMSARILQKLVATDKSPDVRALATQALKGDATSLAVLQDKMDDTDHPYKDFNWLDAADYVTSVSNGWRHIGRELDSIIRGIPGRRFDSENHIASALDKARRAQQRRGFKSATHPYLSIVASHLGRMGRYPEIVGAIRKHIRTGGANVFFKSLSGNVSSSYDSNDGLTSIFTRDGVREGFGDSPGEDPITWVSIQRKYPMGGKWSYSFAVTKDKPETSEEYKRKSLPKKIVFAARKRPDPRLPKRYAKVDGLSSLDPETREAFRDFYPVMS